MAFLSDLLLAAAAFGAAAYCFVLSRRLKALTRLDSGMGGAIALLSAQVDDLTRALAEARERAGAGTDRLDRLATRAEAAGQRLELLLASLHDLPEGRDGDPVPATTRQAAAQPAWTHDEHPATPPHHQAATRRPAPVQGDAPGLEHALPPTSGVSVAEAARTGAGASRARIVRRRAASESV